MTGLPPVRGPGEAVGRVLVAAAAAVCLIAVMLPWVQVPVGFESLRRTGFDLLPGGIVFAAGGALVRLSFLAARRPGQRFDVWRHAACGAGLVVVAVAGWAQVDRILYREVPGVGVHPGTHGAGVRLVPVAAGLVLAAAGWVARARRLGRVS